jgi:Arylsulfotransferase (ASST)
MKHILIYKSCFLLLLFLSFDSLSQQTTVGLRYYNLSATSGYTLITPSDNNNVYLINSCGEKVNEWTFSELPGLTCYLLDNGTLLRAGRDSLEIRDWNNNLLWSYPTTANGLKQHHDIQPLPNGNILCIVSENYTATQMIAAGRNPNDISTPNFKMEKIVELQPTGSNGATIVWEWKFMDHLIQEFDNLQNNFDTVLNHPELLDLNYNNGFLFDYIHLNAIDYNAGLDQIIMSARNTSEVYIIDHSTTMLEASGHVGGNAGKGGDFLWRWGNAAVYQQGTLLDQKLFRQHNVEWVNSGYLDDGKISVFNNGGDITNTFSSVHLIEPQLTGFNYNMSGGTFIPNSFDWTWQGSILGELMLEGKKSGVNSLPNGNLLICETSKGQISEITKTGTLLWAYKNPTGTSIFNQFDSLQISDNEIFRADHYIPSHPGLVGQNLTSLGIIENQNSLSDSCGLILEIPVVVEEEIILVNPVVNGLLSFINPVGLSEVSIIDLWGFIVFEQTNFSGLQLQINLEAGIYVLRLISENKVTTRKILVH